MPEVPYLTHLPIRDDSQEEEEEEESDLSDRAEATLSIRNSARWRSPEFSRIAKG